MSTNDRTTRILAELTERYDLQADFVQKVRPMVDTIFSDDIKDEDRTALLEVLAETCERDLRMRKGSAALREALTGLVDTLKELHDKVRELNELRPKKGDEGEDRQSGDAA